MFEVCSRAWVLHSTTGTIVSGHQKWLAGSKQHRHVWRKWMEINSQVYQDMLHENFCLPTEAQQRIGQATGQWPKA